MSSKWEQALHPRNFIGEFSPVSGSDKRLKKIQKSKAKLVKAQNNFVRTASVRTTGGGRRPLTTAEARKFLNDTNVSVNRVQGHKLARRSAAAKVQMARAEHLKNFGRKPKVLPNARNAGRKLR
jgi:hypothetical protein